MNLTEENLKIAGYKKYHSEHFQYSDCFYQKTLWKDKIKAYHIQLVKYPPMKYHNGVETPLSWMLEMTINRPHMTFELHGAQEYTLEELERRADLFYTSMECEPYEREEE